MYSRNSAWDDKCFNTAMFDSWDDQETDIALKINVVLQQMSGKLIAPVSGMTSIAVWG